MSTTTSKTQTTAEASSVEAAAAAVADAVAQLNAATMAMAAAEGGIREADAELKRIEQCIASDDPSAGMEDLAKADTQRRFFKLQSQAKHQAAADAAQAITTAKTGHIMARLEAGEYGVHMDGMRAEGQDLAEQIAAMLKDYAAKCEEHNAARRQLLADVKESDAIDNDRNGNPESPLAWGHEDSRTHNPRWIAVRGERVPEITPFRVDRVLKHAGLLVTSGTAAATEYAPI